MEGVEHVQAYSEAEEGKGGRRGNGKGEVRRGGGEGAGGLLLCSLTLRM